MPSKSTSWVENGNCSEKVNSVRLSEIQELKIKEEDQSLGKCGEEDENDEEDDDDDDEDDENENFGDSSYPMDLPLEVITTIEPFNYSYPHLKNMSNGVLTHRNIFTEQEREVLRRIVDKYREIVDTRSRTREIYLEKQNVWQQIVEEYNSTENILVRTEKELKKCWDNMKYRARLAEKEQIKAENILNNRKSPDPHQIAYNAVQAALEKMSAIQAQGCHDNSNELNGISKCENNANNAISFDTHDSWGFNEKNNSLSENGEPEKNLRNSDYDSLDDDDDDDDVQPLLKKARQESPKLSSILLGDTKKSSYLKLDSSVPKNQYSIPNCTKVSQIKKKFKKTNGNVSTTHVNILPKGLNSCVSIVNIPNPHQPIGSIASSNSEFSVNGSEINSSGSINLGGGITISPQKASNFNSTSLSNEKSHAKNMPNLKKMLPNKIERKGPASNHNMRYSHQNSITSIYDYNSGNGIERFSLEERLMLQRLEFNSEEHALRMKVLEKQLQAYSNESQFWALKISLLKNGVGAESSTHNGEI